jgi:hypothetical protein
MEFTIIPVALQSATQLVQLSFHQENKQELFQSEQLLSLLGYHCRSDFPLVCHYAFIICFYWPYSVFAAPIPAYIR